MTSLIPDIPQNHEFRLDRPAALVAALPAILGFAPENSLLLVTFAQGSVDAVLRKDLAMLDCEVLAAIAEVTSRHHCDGVVVVVVSDKIGDGDVTTIVDDLAKLLDAQGVCLIAGHVVDKVAVGGRWRCYDNCGAGGPIDDPRCSPLAVAAVVAGRTVHRRREDLVALVEPAATPVDVNWTTSLRSQRRPAADQDIADRRDINRVLAAACQVAEGRPLSKRATLEVARALTVLRVRDILYALAISVLAEDAERLWMQLSRVLPAPWRAESLALLSFSAYVRGDGPLAGVALDAALGADPDHRMARLLTSAIYSGMRPRQIRDVADTGYRLAGDLGISLPQRRVGAELY